MRVRQDFYQPEVINPARIPMHRKLNKMNEWRNGTVKGQLVQFVNNKLFYEFVYVHTDIVLLLPVPLTVSLWQLVAKDRRFT